MTVNRPNFLDTGTGKSQGASGKMYIFVVIEKANVEKSFTEKAQNQQTIIESYFRLKRLYLI